MTKLSALQIKEAAIATNQSLTYIAHLINVRTQHLFYQAELTDRGFPCVISNEFFPLEKSILPATPELSVYAENRLITFEEDVGSYFIYLIDEVSPLAEVELGAAIISRYAHVVLIGTKKTKPFHFHPRCEHYSDWDNFLDRRFFDRL